MLPTQNITDKKVRWTNKSVVQMAPGKIDPIEAIERKARAMVLAAIDKGWKGPPYDPVELAKMNGIEVDARGDIPDARLVPDKKNLRIEYNPTRPRGRLRFSIAHEIAHSLFPDVRDAIRHRAVVTGIQDDSWQLEVLCNIAAAEMLMPLGSFAEFAKQPLSIESVMNLRKKFDVSVEACLIRLVKLADKQVAAFCASYHDGVGYKVDYVIPVAGWVSPISQGQVVPKDSVVAEANAIGFTAAKNEKWGSHLLRVECVGLGPYPGQLVPRVVGILLPRTQGDFKRPQLTEVRGDVLKPQGAGPRVIAHVVPNTKAIWGGGGVASQVRRQYRETFDDFREKTGDEFPVLGRVVFSDAGEELSIAHMIAQRGFGPSASQRLSMAALQSCLVQLREFAQARNASIHLPRIGTGYGGGNWDVIRELLMEELVEKGVSATVYAPPG